MEVTESFTTSDLYLGAAIKVMTKIMPETKNDGSGRVMFIFPSTPEVFSAISQYNAGGAIGAFEYSQQIKRFRSMILSTRS